jgi:hypothetical protein
MRRPSILVIAAIAALILGFLARRTMLPSAAHYLAHRPPEPPQSASEVNPPATANGNGDASNTAAEDAKNSDEDPGTEHLTPDDRSRLDALIKHKEK